MDEQSEQIIEDAKEATEVEPTKVEIVNKDKKVVSYFDSSDDEEYDELGITQEQVEEFEKDE